MYKQLVLINSVLFLIKLTTSVEIKDEESVLVLTSANFDEALTLYPNMLVEFYAPWCGHCKALAPEYAKAATKLAAENSEIRLSKVDATIETKLAEKYKVQGYPTLKFFKDGTDIEYTGGRTSDTIISWLNKKMGSATVVISDVEHAKKFSTSNEVAVVGFFKDADSEEAKVFNSVASLMDEIPFGISSSQDVLNEFEVTGLNQIVLFKKFDEGKNVFSGKYNKEDIMSFIKENQLPIFVEFTQDTAPKIFSGEVKKHLMVFVSKSSSEFNTYQQLFTQIGLKYKGKVIFIFVDSDVEDNERVMEYFNLKKTDTGYRMIELTEDTIKYKPDESIFEVEKIEEFINGVLDGIIKPHFNSQDLPEDWDKNPVKVLVSSNFKAVALDTTKAVFVEFYAPWCGHCKQLAPIWDLLGEHYSSNKDIVIAKIDSTVNELEDIKIQGFPTIKYFPKGSDTVIDYNGDRNLEAFKIFLDSDGKEGNTPSKKQKDEESEDHEEGHTDL